VTMQRFVTGGVESLGEREVGVICSTNELARDGHVLEPSGINLANYRHNPVVLWNHDVNQSPIGTCTSIGIQNGSLAARIEFAPEGMSNLADEICGLAKAGIVRGVSIGFDPLETEPLNTAKPRGGQHITKSELFEISFVNVGADTGAGVVARSFASRPGAEAMLRALPRTSPTSTAGVERALSEIARRYGQQRTQPKPLAAWTPNDHMAARAQHMRTIWAIGQGREAERAARLNNDRHADEVRARQEDESTRIRNMRGRSSG
jgi:HK97 family phage prohead protease